MPLLPITPLDDTSLLRDALTGLSVYSAFVMGGRCHRFLGLQRRAGRWSAEVHRIHGLELDLGGRIAARLRAWTKPADELLTKISSDQQTQIQYQTLARLGKRSACSPAPPPTWKNRSPSLSRTWHLAWLPPSQALARSPPP